MKEKAWPEVAVIVLNHNGKRFLDDCFRSLQQCSYPNKKLIMYDNGSTDDSLSWMSEYYPEVELIAGGSNSGFSYAYNDAMQYTNAPYAVLLNNDVKVDPHWLEPLVKEAESDRSIAALQPKLVLFSDPSKFEYSGSCGGLMDIYGFPFNRGRLFFTVEDDKGQYDSNMDIFWACGAAMFVRVDAYKLCGGLDEHFVHHMEEIDLCWRMHLMGYRLRAVPASKVMHHGGGTITEESFRKMYWNHRNSLFMLYKNLEGKNLFRSMGGHIFWDLVAVMQSLSSFKPRRAHAIMKAYGWLMNHAGLVKRQRIKVQQMRKVSDSLIFQKLYPGSIVFQYFIRKKKTYTAIAGEKTTPHETKQNSRIPERVMGDLS